jgi:hypothetical protein
VRAPRNDPSNRFHERPPDLSEEVHKVVGEGREDWLVSFEEETKEVKMNFLDAVVMLKAVGSFEVAVSKKGFRLKI